MNSIIHYLRRTACVQAGKSLSDGQLLESFLAWRDEAAFEALVRRHGPMVLGVCRRVLGNDHDAEDVFQATFLVLVRKAASIRPRELVGPWLYGVVLRTALKARATSARRHMKERLVGALAAHVQPCDDDWQEMLPHLDRELGRLPDKYRVPVLLCDLEGRSRKEVARQLKLAEGTLSSRLATARKLLAKRLARYGVGVSAGGVALFLAQNGATAAVPAALVAATTDAAIAIAAGQALLSGLISVKVAGLTKGVLQAMLLTKLKTVTFVMCGVTALGLGTGGLVYHARAGADQGDAAQGVASAQFAQAKKAEEATQRDQRLREEKRADEQRNRKLVSEESNYRAAEAQFQQAESNYRAAEAQLQRAQAAEQAARQDVEKLGYDVKVRLAQQELSNRASGLVLTRRENKPKTDFDQSRKALRQEIELLQTHFEKRSNELALAIQRLDKQEADELARMKSSQAEAATRHSPSSSKSSQTPQLVLSAGDKLDRILEKLEQLEMRLSRLERARPQGR